MKETGCWLGMSLGSKLDCSIIYSFPKLFVLSSSTPSKLLVHNNYCSVFVSTAKRLRVLRSSELSHGLVSGSCTFLLICADIRYMFRLPKLSHSWLFQILFFFLSFQIGATPERAANGWNGDTFSTIWNVAHWSRKLKELLRSRGDLNPVVSLEIVILFED